MRKGPVQHQSQPNLLALGKPFGGRRPACARSPIGLWRKRQVRAILDAVLQRPEKMPTILMGDLNEWARHRGCLVEFLHDYRIVFTGPSFHSQRPVARLDRIMVGEELRILRSGTHNTAQAKRASDHLPVWAELAF